MAITRKRTSARISNNTISTTPNEPYNVDAATAAITSREVKKRKAKTTATTSSKTKKRKKTPSTTSESVEKGNTKKNVAIELSEQHPASIFKTPSNPQASFSGLPAELRLQIYAYLCDSSIIHVHKHIEKRGNPIAPFTWTPCRAPNPKSPLLCANPKWSGMCDEKDRCTYKIHAPPEPIGFWALAASNKPIRNETQEFFIRNTVVSIDPQNLEPWLDHLEKHMPKQIEQLRRITLAGPNTWRYFTQPRVQLLRQRVPNLEGVGMQCQDASWRWFSVYNGSRYFPEGYLRLHEWRQWNIVEWMKEFNPSIAIAMEAIVCQRGIKAIKSIRPFEVLEQQTAIRICREGKKITDGEEMSNWDDDDVNIEVDRPGKLVAASRTAEWREWWRDKDTKTLT